MNGQRAFWISGFSSLTVAILLGSALWARSQPTELPPASSQFVSIPAIPEIEPIPQQTALRKELELAYSDLNTAYREIERLQASEGGGEREHDDDDDEHETGRGDRHEHEREGHE